jgi:hypothetical protein
MELRRSNERQERAATSSSPLPLGRSGLGTAFAAAVRPGAGLLAWPGPGGAVPPGTGRGAARCIFFVYNSPLFLLKPLLTARFFVYFSLRPRCNYATHCDRIVHQRQNNGRVTKLNNNRRGVPSSLRFRSTMIFFLLYRARLAKSAHGVAPLHLRPPRNRATTSPYVLTCALNRALPVLLTCFSRAPASRVS